MDRSNRPCMTFDYPHIMDLYSFAVVRSLLSFCRAKQTFGRAAANGFAMVSRDLRSLVLRVYHYANSFFADCEYIFIKI